MPPDDLLLLPRPRHLELLGEGPSVDTPVDEHHVPSLPAEGYELDITAGGVAIRHADADGARRARATLDQLRAQSAEQLPALTIRDHPDFPVRGFMLDISRDRVPTLATLERLVEVMALARLNQLQLYTEHTFSYRDHDVVWCDASPMTPEDLRWLDALCADRGIELVANQNTFGHMGRWLAHAAYRDRALAPDGFELLPGVTLPPGTLAPTPENAAFALELLDELLPNFASRRVHIGCDETFELDDADAYLVHLHRLVGPLVDAGYQVLFWADVVRRHPELVARLPPGALPVVWTYEAPQPASSWPDLPSEIGIALDRLGVDADFIAGFDRLVAPFADAGLPFWVAPGTSSWNSLVGRIDNATANLVDAASVGLACGATGYLITDWGDNGHLQPPPVSFGPLLYGGAVSWCVETNRDLDLAGALDRFVFDAPGTGRVLDELGRLWGRTGQTAYNASPLQAALCPTQLHLVVGEPDAAAVATVIEKLDRAIDALDEPSLRNAARLARHGAWRLLARAGGRAPNRAARRADLRDAIAEYEECWLAWSRPGGMPESRAQLEATLATYD